ncbi:MAG: phosphopantothenoylcysteine decarboxylase [Myxococcota bacterium]
MKVLITAGATRNPVDAVRVITANASGKTGVSVGRALSQRGCEVHVLGSPEAVLRARAAGLTAEEYGSTTDLMQRMERWVRAEPAGSVVHSAAVGDYRLADEQAGKLPSGQSEVVIRLVPTPKIADRVRGWGCAGAFITFKAAAPLTSDQDLLRIASAQRLRTGSDWVFANVLGRLQAGVWLVGETHQVFDDRSDAIAALIERLAERAAV